MDKNINFLEKCNSFLRKRYNSLQTQKCYLKEIKLFIYNFNDPYQITNKNIQSYLDKYKDFGRSKQNQVIASLKCLYVDVLKRKNFKYKFIRAKRIEYLPILKPKQEIIEIISKINNIKHKTIISLLYGCGLRRQEIINLKIEDILGKQNLLKIVQSKGNKDRMIPISNNLLTLLRDYYKEFNPKIYLFEGQKKQQYSGGSIEKIVKKWFGNNFYPHLLRHCYGTHLYEAKVELSKIQKLMGHDNIKSTQIYTKTANNLQDIPQLI